MLDLKDRVIMISGASRGIGRAAADLLLTKGCKISAGMRDPSAFPEDDNAMSFAYEAENPQSAKDWVAATAERFDRIDGIFAAAGINPKVVVFGDQASEETLEKMWRVNVMAPLRLVRAAKPHLVASGDGRVVIMGSLASKRAGSNVGYSMTKHAVAALNHGIRREGRADGIRSTLICPGYVATDMTIGEDEVPRHEMSQPADVAELVATALSLPGNASVSELLIHCQFEPML